MSNFSVPPTQVPIAAEDQFKRFLTDPQWLRWFLEVARAIDSSGIVSPQTANYVFAGPTSGAAAEPTWRLLVGSDIPGSVYAFAAAHG